MDIQKHTLQFSVSLSADTGKRRPVNKSAKPISHNTRDFKKHYVNSRTTNPFIMFFLQLHNKQPKEHVTRIARIAGKLWSRMTSEERKKYIDLANAEKRRREKRKKRKHSSAYPR